MTSDEARYNLEAYGPNEIAKKKKRIAIIEFLSLFTSPLVIILLVAGSISAFLDEPVETVIIFTIVFLSVLLDFHQQNKAHMAAEMLRDRVSTTADVLRDGKASEIKVSAIVPGDVVSLSAGSMVPSDGRILEAKDLFVNQSVLTGESFPVEKVPTSLAKTGTPLLERNDHVFMGTSVVSGTARALMLKTGGQTEYGKIARRLSAGSTETEYERGIKRFGMLIVKITFALVIFVFLVNIIFKVLLVSTILKKAILDSILFSVALAVGLTPELLPMIMSVNLAKGALNMSKKGVIVKRLPSIQNLGSMDVFCTDKTGTLTENTVILLSHIDMEGSSNEKVLQFSYLNSYFQTGIKSPLDEAIQKHEKVDVSKFKKIDEVPFDFVRRRLSVVVENDGAKIMITKGAPEEIAKICSTYEVDGITFELAEELRRKIDAKFRELSEEGLRVLGVAYRVIDTGNNFCATDECMMIFLGFVVFMDPPKAGVGESLALIKKTNIELKILTGDNELITKSTCKQIGFEMKGVVLGSEIAGMTDTKLARIAESANVFARLTPDQKNRIINALRASGHVVGFLGDGMNDAPSLKTADVGISVDNAVDAAKDSADIILLQKDLRVLGEGVLEGRRTFDNTMKYIMMGTSSNFGNMFSVAVASIFLPFLPMLPIQILLNNLLYDTSELTIPTDNVDMDHIERPRRWNMTFVMRFMLVFGLISSVFDIATFVLMLNVFHTWDNHPLFWTAWFIESLSTQTLVIFVIRTRKSPFYKSRPSIPIVISSISVVILAIVMPFTPLGALFKFTPPPWTFFIVLAGLVVVYLMLVETVKERFYKKYVDGGGNSGAALANLATKDMTTLLVPGFGGTATIDGPDAPNTGPPASGRPQ